MNVMMTYGVVSFLVSVFTAWVGSLVALRPLGKPPPVFWVDRARLAYPARLATALSMVLLPFVACGMLFALIDSDRDRPGGGEIGWVMAGAFLGGLVVALRTEKYVRGTAFQLGSWVRSFVTRIIILSPHLGALIAAPMLLPDTLTLQAVEILAPITLVLAFGATGGGFMLLRMIGLASTASPRLATTVADAAACTGIRPRAAYELKSSTANGLAIPFWKRLVITDKAMGVLNDAELTAICVHELAHLGEPRAVLALRVCSGLLLFFPILAYRPVVGDFGYWGLLVLLGIALLIVVATRRVARRMEERADAAGRAHQSEEGLYARALERLYEANLLPAVMSGKRHVHPHLYDRLIAAGVTPSYPRPAPPSKSVRMLSMLVTIVTAAALYYIAFRLLLDGQGTP